MRMFPTPEEAAAEAGPDQCISVTFTGRLVDGKPQLKPDAEPVYFLAPVDADEDTMRELAFEVHHGKPMDKYQRACLQSAKELVGR